MGCSAAIGERPAIPIRATVFSGTPRRPDPAIGAHPTLHRHPHGALPPDPQSTSDTIAPVRKPSPIPLTAVSFGPGFSRERGTVVRHRNCRRRFRRDEAVYLDPVGEGQRNAPVIHPKRSPSPSEARPSRTPALGGPCARTC